MTTLRRFGLLSLYPARYRSRFRTECFGGVPTTKWLLRQSPMKRRTLWHGRV